VVRRSTQLLDLPNEVGLLIVELFVFRTVCVEPRQKLDQLVLVAQQDIQDWLWFVGVRNKYLKKSSYYIEQKKRHSSYCQKEKD